MLSGRSFFAGIPVSIGALNYAVTELPDDSDGQVDVTTRLMGEYAKADAKEPAIAQLAQTVRRFTLDETLRNLFTITNHVMVFAKDEERFYPGKKFGDAIEALIRPVDVLHIWQKTGKPVPGDCDDFTMFGASLLEALGVPWEVVTTKSDQRSPAEWSHVYLVVTDGQGKRIPLDLSHGKYVGWEVPAYERKTWVRGSARPLGVVTATAEKDLFMFQPTQSGLQGSGYDWSSMFGNIAQQFSGALATRIATPAGTYRNAQTGEEYRQPTGVPISASSLTTNVAGNVGANLNTGGLSINAGTLLLVGGAVVLVMLLRK